MTASSKALIDELWSIVSRRHTRDHPFVRRIGEGRATRDELRFFALQYYHRTARLFPKLVAAIYSRCPEDPDIEHMLLENVFSESGFDRPQEEHKRLYFQFAEALGVSRREIEAARPVPELQAFIGWRDRVFYDAHWLEAVTVQSFVFEGQNVHRAAVIGEGLRRHYGFSDQEAAFWIAHASEVEAEHAEVGPLAVDRYATTDDVRERLRRLVAEGVEVYWLVFDGIARGALSSDGR